MASEIDAAVWVAVVNGLFAILILIGGAVLNVKIKKVSAAVHETKDEVKNSHTINFRDDMDSKFMYTNELIEGVLSTQRVNGRAITDLRLALSTHMSEERKRSESVHAELSTRIADALDKK